MVIAALLHDAVEDHGGLPRLGEIRRKFGAPVAHEPADVRLVSAADKLSNARETLAGLRRHVMATALLPSSRAKKLAVCGTTALWLPYFAPQAAIRS
jgi:(p)ppGpp synthase/HD superfamily hydrolase